MTGVGKNLRMPTGQCFFSPVGINGHVGIVMIILHNIICGH
jgi:hypothetical protein